MQYALFIGLRYLRAKRQEAFISLITIIATGGVAIGVMTLNVVLSVMTGFEEDLRDRILGVNPHVLVMSYRGVVEDAAGLLARVRAVPDVEAAAPFVYGQVMVSTASKVSGALVRGLPPGTDGPVDIERHLTSGHVAALQERHPVSTAVAGQSGVTLPGIILGKGLARQLVVEPGAAVSLVSPVGIPTVVGLVPRVKRFVVVGLFDSGMSEYDSALAYVSLSDAQRFFGMGEGVTGIEVRVRDLYRADRVSLRLTEELGFPYRVRDWMEMNHNIFSALKLEKTVYFIVLLLIVLLSIFTFVV